MEHEVLADVDGVVRELAVAVGEAVSEGQLLATLEPGPVARARGAEQRRGAAGRAGGRAGRPAGGPRAPRDRPRPRRARRRSPAATSAGGGRRGRTSTSSSTRARSSSTGRCCSPPRSAGARREELIARTPADGLVGGVGEVDGRALRGDVLRLHRPGGHPGDAQPRQEGPPVRARRAAPAAGRAVRRGRRRAARATWTCRSSPGSTAAPSPCSPRSAGWSRSWAWRPATASPATPRCSAAATW